MNLLNTQFDQNLSRIFIELCLRRIKLEKKKAKNVNSANHLKVFWSDFIGSHHNHHYI